MKRLLLAALLMVQIGQAAELEFMHWWTSRGERRAVAELAETLKQNGLPLREVPVPGGGGDNARTILQARTLSGSPPHLALLQGPTISSWAALGLLHPLPLSHPLPPLVERIHRANDEMVALPIALHRLNWLWLNRRELDRNRLAPPTDWETLVVTLERLRQAGRPGLAIGNDPWQIAQLFENLLFGLGGPDLYHRLFVTLEPSALRAPATREALSYFRRIARTVAPVEALTWDQAALGLKEGHFAMQITGDWVLGEWLDDAGRLPPDLLCLPTPARQPGFIFNIDSLVMMRGAQHAPASTERLTELLSDPAFLQRFNRKKGSIPVQTDIALPGFNPCSRQARIDFIAALERGSAVPSFSDSMATCPVIRNALLSELHRFFLDPRLSEKEMLKILERIRQGKELWCPTPVNAS